MADHTIPEPGTPSQMEALTHDSMNRLIAQRNEATARATLIQALIVMGRLEEAQALELSDEGNSWINKLIKAESRDDDHRCECNASLDVQDYARFPDGDPVLKEMPRYIPTFRHYSMKYNAMVWFYKCSVCGCVQSLPDETPIDEFHTTYYDARQATLASHISKGVPVREV